LWLQISLSAQNRIIRSNLKNTIKYVINTIRRIIRLRRMTHPWCRSRNKGRRSRNKGRRSRNKGRRSRNKGRRSRNKGRRTRNKGCRSRNKGRRSRNKGRRSRREGRRSPQSLPERMRRGLFKGVHHPINAEPLAERLAEPHNRCRAKRSMQSHPINAEPPDQCRATCRSFCRRMPLTEFKQGWPRLYLVLLNLRPGTHTHFASVRYAKASVALHQILCDVHNIHEIRRTGTHSTSLWSTRAVSVATSASNTV